MRPTWIQFKQNNQNKVKWHKLSELSYCHSYLNCCAWNVDLCMANIQKRHCRYYLCWHNTSLLSLYTLNSHIWNGIISKICHNCLPRMVKHLERVGAGLSTQCAAQQVATAFCKAFRCFLMVQSSLYVWFVHVFWFLSLYRLLINFYE